MLLLRPRAKRAPWIHSSAVTLFLLSILAPAAAHAGIEAGEPQLGVQKAIAGAHRTAGAAGAGVANSNCAGTECDTVWIGHRQRGPGGAFLGVGVGGVWDFDTGIAGTDSTQGWQRWALHYRSGGTRPAAARPEWALDYGNKINEGNTNLWNARNTAGRKYMKTGVAGAWHSDTMAGVKLNVSNGAEPSATPIAGTRSAWCGFASPATRPPRMPSPATT